MDGFTKRHAQIVLACAVLLLIISFLDWQQVSFLGISAGANEWHGIGVLAGLLTIALIAWEAMLLFGVKISLGSVSESLVSVVLAECVALFTIIYFLTHTDAQHWPAYLGLILAIAIAVVGFMRGKAEGVQLPERGGTSTAGSGPAEASAPAADTDSSDGGAEE